MRCPVQLRGMASSLMTAAPNEAMKSAFLDLQNVPQLGEPEDIAAMAAFLASDDAAFITGQVISVSGGLTMHG